MRIRSACHPGGKHPRPERFPLDNSGPWRKKEVANLSPCSPLVPQLSPQSSPLSPFKKEPPLTQQYLRADLYYHQMTQPLPVRIARTSGGHALVRLGDASHELALFLTLSQLRDLIRDLQVQAAPLVDVPEAASPPDLDDTEAA